MGRRLISTGSLFEREIGYSRAVVVGNQCFMSGVTGYDYTTMKLPADIETQTRNCFRTIEHVLGEAGFTMHHLVKMTYILPDRALVPVATSVFGEVLGSIRPAATMIIAGLMEPEMLVEVEAIAVKDA
ncbi:RidA family protein [Tropicimonas sp. S265A]|uniref:RidA family protein n=1 Tax=Tropicimonas sp. S265A TaxID=3415134 RepID=UPI003C7EC3C4